MPGIGSWVNVVVTVVFVGRPDFGRAFQRLRHDSPSRFPLHAKMRSGRAPACVRECKTTAQSWLTLRRVGRGGRGMPGSVKGRDDAGREEIGEIGCVGGVAEEGGVSALCSDVEDLLHGAEVG